MANRYVPTKTRLADAVSLESMLLSGPQISNPFLSTVSLEDDKSVARKVWEWIKALFKKLFEKIKGLFTKAKVVDVKAANVAKETANIAKQAGLSKDIQISVSYPSLGFIKGSESGKLELLKIDQAMIAAKSYVRSIVTNFKYAINDSLTDKDNLSTKTPAELLYNFENNTGIGARLQPTILKQLNIISLSDPSSIAKNSYVSTALSYTADKADEYTVTVSNLEYALLQKQTDEWSKDNYSSIYTTLKEANDRKDKLFSQLNKTYVDGNFSELFLEASKLYADTFRLVDTEVTKALMLYNSGLDIIAACNKKISGGHSDSAK